MQYTKLIAKMFLSTHRPLETGSENVSQTMLPVAADGSHTDEDRVTLPDAESRFMPKISASDAFTALAAVRRGRELYPERGLHNLSNVKDMICAPGCLRSYATYGTSVFQIHCSFPCVLFYFVCSS